MNSDNQLILGIICLTISIVMYIIGKKYIKW
jgi:hypothetical protein